MPVSISPPASGVVLGPGRAGGGRDRNRCRDPRGLCGIRAAAIRTGRTTRHRHRQLARAHRLGLPRRDPRRAHQHRPRPSRSSSSRACASRSSWSRPFRPSGSSRSTSSPAASAALADSGRRRADGRCRAPDSRVGDPALAGPHPSLRHEKLGREVWLLPGGGVQCGREPRDGASARAMGGDRALSPRSRGAARGPCRDRRLDRARCRAVPKARDPRDLRGRRDSDSARGRRVRGRRRRGDIARFSMRRARLGHAPSADPPLSAALAARRSRRSTSARCGFRDARIRHTLGTVRITTRDLPRYAGSGWWDGVPLWNTAPSALSRRASSPARAATRKPPPRKLVGKSVKTSAARPPVRGRAPARGASLRATGSAAGAARGDMSRPRARSRQPSKPDVPSFPNPCTTRPSGSAPESRSVRPAWFSNPASADVRRARARSRAERRRSSASRPRRSREGRATHPA